MSDLESGLRLRDMDSFVQLGGLDGTGQGRELGAGDDQLTLDEVWLEELLRVWIAQLTVRTADTSCMDRDNVI